MNLARLTKPSSAASLVPLGLLLLSTAALSETFTQEEPQIFQPPAGASQGIFPGVDLNVFKQYVVEIDESASVGASVEIDLLFDTLEFGGSLEAGIGAAFGVEVGFCFGGQADFEMAFQPSVTLPDSIPYDFPVPLTVAEGRQESSYFATSFGAPQAYADLIFDLNAYLRARACVGYCFDLPFPELRTRDLPPPFDLFKESTRCDPFIEEKKFYGIELAALNRGDDRKLRFLNVAPERKPGQSRIAAFLEEPYREFTLGDLVPTTISGQVEREPGVGTRAVLLFESSRLAKIPADPEVFFKNWTVSFTGSSSLPEPFAEDLSQDPEVDYEISEVRELNNFFEFKLPVSFEEAGECQFTIKPPKELVPEGLRDGTYGDVTLTFPTVTTNSSDPRGPVDSADFLRSSGAEDMMALNVKVTNIVEEILQSSIEASTGLDFPGFTGSLDAGPINASYTLATLDIGPSMELKTEFELSWGLVVQEINFYELACDEETGECSRTDNPASVKIFWPQGHPYFVPGDPQPISQFTPDARGEVQFTNCGTCALPMISLRESQPDVEVEIKYGLKPQLKTKISTPFIGNVSYSAIGASAGIDGVGDIGFGPLLDDEHKFQIGDATVFDGAPKVLESVGTGTLSFPMRASGPAEYDYVGGVGGNEWAAEDNSTNPARTNWSEVSSMLTTSWPGKVGGSNLARIELGGGPSFKHPAGQTTPVTISALTVGPSSVLAMRGPNPPVNAIDPDLHVRDGVIENNGNIAFFDANSSALLLDHRDTGGGSSEAAAILCGTGELAFLSGGGLRGYSGPKDFSFTNFNRIRVFSDSPTPVPVMDLPGFAEPAFYWDFEGANGLIDTAGGTPGILQNGATLIPEGHTGNGLRLNGNNGRMLVSDVRRLNNAARGDQVTISYWQKQDEPQQGFAFFTLSPSGGDRGLSAHSPFTDGKVYFYTTGIPDVTIAEPVPPLDVTQWHHFALVKNGDVTQIWIDGALVEEREGVGELRSDYPDLIIGSAAPHISNFSMRGVLDDFAVFASALDGEDIASLASGTPADAIPRETTINNIGSISASRGILESSATHVVNQGEISAVGVGGSTPLLELSGKHLSTRRGSSIEAGGDGFVSLIDFETVDHAGIIDSSGGAELDFSPPFGKRAVWNAGQSLAGDCAIIQADAGFMNLSRSDFDGGCFFVRDAGGISLEDCLLKNSHLRIGEKGDSEFDPGLLTLSGESIRFENVTFENFGTLTNEATKTTFAPGTVLFVNHGKLVVEQGTEFQIFPNRFGNLSDPNEAVFFYPGIANYSFSLAENGDRQGALLGGTWDISGSMNIVSAAITELGGNSAASSVGSATRLDDGAVISGDAQSNQISGGLPAVVDLRGPDADFVGLGFLKENRGTLRLHDGAALSNNQSSSGDLVNRGTLSVDGASELRVLGKFIQAGSDAETAISAGGTFEVGAQDFQILGGSFSLGAGSGFAGGILPSGSSLRIQAPLIESGEINPFTGLPEPRQAFVDVDLADGISGIAAGASLELQGRVISFLGADPEGIHFPGLELTSNAGSFKLRGDGFPYSPDIDVDDNFTNTGSIDIRGSGSRLDFDESFTQNGPSASIRVGPGASLRFQQATISAGELVVEISTRSPEGWFGNEDSGTYGAGYFVPFQGVDLNGRLVIDFVGDVAEGKVDIGDTWEIAPRTYAVSGVTGAEAAEFRYQGGAIPADWLPPGATLEIVQFQRNGPPGGTFGLAIRVVPAGGFTDYYTWASQQGLPDRISSPLADPFADGNGNGIPNAAEFFYGLNGIDLTNPYVEFSMAPSAGGGIDNTMSFLRPSGVDASYTPYVSEDLITWSLAPMVIQDITAQPGNGLELVTLESLFAAQETQLFFRIQPNFNPDNFENGLLPDVNDDRLIGEDSSLRNLDNGLDISYQFVPGRVLFFKVTGTRRSNGGSVYGGTAEDGETRNFIYQDRSFLATAAVHAGLLNIDERGLIKVTLLPPQPTFRGSIQKVKDGTEEVFSEPAEGFQVDEIFSYRIDLVRLLD